MRIFAQIAAGAIPAEAIARAQHLIFNNYLNVGVTAILVGLILFLIFEALTLWIGLLRGTKESTLNETPYVATQWPAEGKV